MANTLRITTNQLEIDANNQQKFSTEIVKTYTFTESFKKELIFGNSASFVAVDFGNVSNAKFLIIDSDQNLDILINGQQYQNTNYVAINATLTSLEIKNISSPNATVIISVYGES